MWIDISITNWQGKRGCEDILMFVRDEIKFVKNFAGIIDKSTPHLYLSALPFSPSNSIMARYLLDRFPGIAKIVVGQHYVWLRSQQVLQGHTDWVTTVVSRIDRFSLSPIGGGFQRGRDGSRGEQGSSQRY